MPTTATKDISTTLVLTNSVGKSAGNSFIGLVPGLKVKKCCD